MRAEVESLFKSGQTIREFCTEKPYTIHKLGYWKNKVLRESANPVSTPSGFVALRPSTILDKQDVKVEIICPNGIKINVFEPVTASFIKSLL